MIGTSGCFIIHYLVKASPIEQPILAEVGQLIYIGSLLQRYRSHADTHGDTSRSLQVQPIIKIKKSPADEFFFQRSYSLRNARLGTSL